MRELEGFVLVIEFLFVIIFVYNLLVRNIYLVLFNFKVIRSFIFLCV